MHKTTQTTTATIKLTWITEYVPIGPRFSNVILQTLLVLFKRIPPKGRKLLVIGTATKRDVLQEMDFMDCFSTVLSTPVIKNYTEFKAALEQLELVDKSELHIAAQSFTTESITIKKLIMVSLFFMPHDPTARVYRQYHPQQEGSSFNDACFHNTQNPKRT